MVVDAIEWHDLLFGTLPVYYGYSGISAIAIYTAFRVLRVISEYENIGILS